MYKNGCLEREVPLREEPFDPNRYNVNVILYKTHKYDGEGLTFAPYLYIIVKE
jgi:hypothetical protein